MSIPLSKHYENFVKYNKYDKLNADQKEFARIFFLGGNTLLTSSAGCGKTFVMDVICDFLYWRDFPIAKTALTGVASLTLGGMTIYSWAGIGLGDEDVNSLLQKVRKNKKAKNRIKFTKILVIDEISMMSAALLDKLDIIFKEIRQDSAPFGGLKICAVGDYLQLLPIFKNTFGGGATFAFNATSWLKAKFKIVQLTTLIRQDNNSDFAKLLQNIRLGRDADWAVLDSAMDRKIEQDSVIKIFCKNADVNKYNQEKLDSIKEQSKRYYCQDTGESRYSDYFDRNCPAPKTLELKKGALVMLLKNIDTEGGLVNGSTGICSGFTTDGVVVKFKNGKETIISNDTWEVKEQEVKEGKLKYKVVASRCQIPLKLAFAATVHKIQSQTLDAAHIDFTGAFCEHQVYSALSRVKSIDGLTLSNFHPCQIKVNQECLEFYQKC